MKKIVSFLLIAIFLLQLKATKAQLFYQDYTEDSPPVVENLESSYAPFGEVFTPKDSLRCLVIFAGFNNPKDGHEIQHWPKNPTSLPNYVNSTTGSMETFIYQNESDFATYANDAENLSLSKFYYEMSGGTFKFFGDVFKDPNTGLPVRINIDTTFNNWTQANKMVLEKAKELYPNFDFSPYDKRTNSPNFQYDNSISDSDYIPDYVIIIYRYSPKWGDPKAIPYVPDVVQGLRNKDGSQGGISILTGATGINYNGYTFNSNGYTHCAGSASVGTIMNLFKHEVSHELFSCPHVMGANGAMGSKWNLLTTGYGMMSGSTRINATANGWERWLLGWIELTSKGENTDIKSAEDLNSTATYTLRDFVTTGDVVRIKLPFAEEQYLWIENHQKKSVFDKTALAGEVASIDGEAIADMAKGLYMYIEGVQGSREGISLSLISTMAKLNSIRLLNPQGNYDYIHSSTAPIPINENFWGAKLFTFKRTIENPISGTNPWYLYLDDFPDTITNANTTNNSITYTGHGFNKSSKEGYSITRQWNENDEDYMLFENVANTNYEGRTFFGHQDSSFLHRETSFLQGDVINISSNPMITSLSNYDTLNFTILPTKLNGIQVEVLSQSGDEITIRVRFDKTEIENNVRWTGNIELNNITADDKPDIVVSTGNVLLLNKSQTPNRHTLTAEGDFVNPTVFTAKSGSKIVIQSGSEIILDEKSTMILEECSQLIIEAGANLRIKNNSKLNLRNGAFVFVNGQIIQETGGLIIAPSITQQSNATIYYRTNSIVGTLPACNLYPVLPSNIASNTIINGNCAIFNDLTVNVLKTLTVNNGTLYSLNNNKITVNAKAKLELNNSAATTVNFCNASPTTWQGIEVLGNSTMGQSTAYQGYVNLINSTIENATVAIQVGTTTSNSGGIVQCSNTTFRNNRFGVVFSAYPTISGSYFRNCTFEITKLVHPVTFVKLNTINDVKFNGCTFRNAYNNYRWGTGIEATNSRFAVDLYGTTKTTFQNLAYGVNALSTGSLAVSIKNSVFTNCFRSAYLNSTSGAVVTNNIFTIGNHNYNLPSNNGDDVPVIDGDAYGLYLDNSTGYTVENNSFTTAYTQKITGLIVKNSGTAQNQIQGNTFTTLPYGVTALGNNTNLQLKCNQFTSNQYDISGKDGIALSSTQGSSALEAGNRFSSNAYYNIFYDGTSIVTIFNRKPSARR